MEEKHSKTQKKHAKKEEKHDEVAVSLPSKKVMYGILAVIILAAVIYFVSKSMAGSSALATVNGEKITQKDMDDFYRRIPTQYRQQITQDQVLDQTISEKLLLQEANRKGITVPEDEVRQRIQESLTKSGVSQDKLDQTLKDQGLVFDDLVIAFQHQLIISKLMDSIGGKTNVTEDQAKQFYDANPQMFTNSTFADVKAELIKGLQAQLGQKMLQEYVVQLRSDAIITMKNK